MGKHYQKYEGETVTLGRKLLRETKGDYIAVDLFQYICYWVLKNEDEDVNYVNGKYWTYFSVKGVMAIPDYDYLTDWQIKRALRCLVDLGLVQRDNHNETKYNHTPWYTVDKKIIEYYQPNLIRLFKKKKSDEPRLQMQSSLVENSTDDGRNFNRRREDLQPSTVAKSPDNISYIDNNHTNNLANNQEKKDIIFLNSQHQRVDMVVSEVEGDSKGDAKNEHPLTPEQWKKYSKKMPQGRFDDTLAQDLKDWIDKYGEEKVDEYVDYVARFWDNITYLPKFVEKVGEQLDLDASDARRNGRPFGKIKNEYRMRW